MGFEFDASMGPPLKAAENNSQLEDPTYIPSGFNGAAAKSSGKFDETGGAYRAEICFNGAAAKSSGK